MKAFKEALKSQHLILSLGLGIFILLAGGVSFTSAWMMTLALFFNLFLSTSILYVLKNQFQEENKWILIMIVMASVATFVQMVAVAYLPGWTVGLGEILPFIAISGLVLARIETVVMTETYANLFWNTLGSVIGFASLVLPIGLFADFLGLGMIQFANPFSVNEMLFQFEMLSESLRMPIFQGSQGAIGILLLASLWIALVQRLRGNS
ncbi:MAG: Rnf-Nqr domain containing protein [Bacilli bacterium]